MEKEPILTEVWGEEGRIWETGNRIDRKWKSWYDGGRGGGGRMREPKQQGTALFWARNMLCGALIGAGAILPGVSGGVLAIVFGIYQPVMEMLTHPRCAVPKCWRILPPLGIGCGVGFLLLAAK